MATSPSSASSPAPGSTNSQQKELDAKASRLVQAAQRASEATKRALSAGVETTQVRMRQVGDVVLDNTQRATGSSKEFLSKIQDKAGHYAGVVQERTGHYVGKAQEKGGQYSGVVQERALAYKDNVSRAIQQSRDGEGEQVGFPLSVFVWCSTLCGGSKKKGAGDGAAPREMESHRSGDREGEGGEQYSSEMLGNAADQYAAALEDEANKLDEAVAEKEQRERRHSG